MNSVAAIATLMGLSFGAVYPLCLWCNKKSVIARFYHYQLLLAAVSGLTGISLLWYFKIGLQLRLSGLVWLAALSATTAFYWGRDRIHIMVISIPSLFGLVVFYQVTEIIIFPALSVFLIQISGSVLLGLTLLLTVNISKTPDNTEVMQAVWYILRTVLAVLVIRLVWIAYSVIWGPISQMPEVFSLQEFLITVQGYIPGFAVLFGILIPLLSIGLVFLQVQRNSYHLALNLLYPTLVSVLIAEILFKYYLFQYGIVL